jgi:hypothetical protein
MPPFTKLDVDEIGARGSDPPEVAANASRFETAATAEYCGR